MQCLTFACEPVIWIFQAQLAEFVFSVSNIETESIETGASSAGTSSGVKHSCPN